MENLPVRKGVRTTLVTGINSTVTSITIANSSEFPVPDFRIKIGSEKMLVTSIGGGTTWTVQRAIESSVAAAHSSGVTVLNLLTGKAVETFFDSHVATESTKGTVQLATNAESSAGTSTTKVVTPAGVQAHFTGTVATESVKGPVQLATNTEAQTGTSTTKVVTPAGVKSVLDAGINSPTIDTTTVNATDVNSSTMDITNQLTAVNGTPPGTNLTNGFRLYSSDVSAGKASPHFRNEVGDIIKLYEETALTAANNTAIDATYDAVEQGVINNLRTRLNELETKLRNMGLLA